MSKYEVWFPTFKVSLYSETPFRYAVAVTDLTGKIKDVFTSNESYRHAARKYVKDELPNLVQLSTDIVLIEEGETHA